MADLKISALNSLAGADLVAADVVAVVDDSASETKKLTVSDLIANGTTLISDNTIPSAKILFAAGAIDTAELAASAVETAKINDSAVTAAKLADNSSVTLVSTLPASGDFTGQIALDTDDNKIYIWDGSAWDSVKGAGSINVVNGSTTGEINIVASTSGDTVTISATLDDTTAAAQFLGGPTGAGGTVGYRALVGTDLPTASTTAKGGVIVNGNGLTMSADTIAIDNTVTAEATDHHIVQYDANGLVTGGRVIAAADVPVATSTTIGVVKPGSGLGVTAAGELNHDNTITAGTAAKVTFDTEGHITDTESLVAADIPDLDADKVTSGAFPTARIASAAVTGDKLANFAVAQISETTPTADFTSQFFFNPITRDLFLWDGNVFQPVGISAGEIVLAGTYDASTNLLDSVTADGSAAGFTNGASLPAADTGNNRYYVVVSQSGTGSAPAPAVALEPPDIILSNGTSYVLIETSETITAQIASNVGFTPTGNIAGTNVQAALSEVDSEKLAKGGDTMTGDLTLNNVNVVFEGATENDFETTLTVTDPTADRTITLPNVTGTVVTTGDTGSVTSTMITDATIVNADISASAEIAVSKLGNGSARQVLQTDSLGTGVEFSDDLDLPGTLDVTGAATLDSTLAVTGATTTTGVINADGKVKFPAGTASAPSFYSGTDTNTGLYFSAADEVSITTGGTQRVVVDSSGNVGIGRNTPTAKLALQTSSDDDIFQVIGYNFLKWNGGNQLHYGGYDSSQWGTLTFSTSGSERLRITTTGNVGIGTSSPNAALQVGETSVNSARAIRIKNNDNTGTAVKAQLELLTNQGTSTIGATNPGNIILSPVGTGVGIGTTSPSSELHVAASSGYAELRLAGASGSGGTLEFYDSTTQLGDIFIDPSNNLVFRNTAERMRIDSSGNVGVGTTSPNNKLTVQDGYILVRSEVTTGSNNINHIGFSATATGGIAATIGSARENANEASALTFNTWNGSAFGERARIDSSGTLGVGCTPNSFQSGFDAVQIGGNLVLNVDSTGAGAGVYMSNNVYRDSGNSRWEYINTDEASQYLQFDGQHVWRHAASGSANAAITWSESMRLDSSGNVGIGTTNPVADLVVSNGGASGIELQSEITTNTNRITNFNRSSSSYNNFRLDAAQHEFLISGSEKARIDSSGRLLVGTSSTSTESTLVLQGSSSNTSTAPILRLARGSTPLNNYGLGAIEFGDNGHTAAARIETARDGGTWTSGSSHPIRMTFSTTADGASSPTERVRIDDEGILYSVSENHGHAAYVTASAGTAKFLFRGYHSANAGSYSTGTISFTVWSNGNVENTNDSYGAISDIKLKENIVDAGSQWDDFKAVRFRKYNFKEETGYETFTQLGVIAQELEQICPGLVEESPDLDEEGNYLGTTTKSVKYSILTKKALVALQEAMDRIETLEAKVAALEAE